MYGGGAQQQGKIKIKLNKEGKNEVSGDIGKKSVQEGHE